MKKKAIWAVSLYLLIACLSFKTCLADDFLDHIISTRAEAQAQQRYFLSLIEDYKKEAKVIARAMGHAREKGIIQGMPPQLLASAVQQSGILWKTIDQALGYLEQEYTQLSSLSGKNKELWKLKSIQGALKEILNQINRTSVIAFNDILINVQEVLRTEYDDEKQTKENVILFNMNNNKLPHGISQQEKSVWNSYRYLIKVNRQFNDHPETQPHHSLNTPEFRALFKIAFSNTTIYSSYYMDFTALLNVYSFLAPYLVNPNEISEHFWLDFPQNPTNLWVDQIANSVLKGANGSNSTLYKLIVTNVPFEGTFIHFEDSVTKIVESLTQRFIEKMQPALISDQNTLAEVFQKAKEKRAKKYAKKKARLKKKAAEGASPVQFGASSPESISLSQPSSQSKSVLESESDIEASNEESTIPAEEDSWIEEEDLNGRLFSLRDDEKNSSTPREESYLSSEPSSDLVAHSPSPQGTRRTEKPETKLNSSLLPSPSNSINSNENSSEDEEEELIEKEYQEFQNWLAYYRSGKDRATPSFSSSPSSSPVSSSTSSSSRTTDTPATPRRIRLYGAALKVYKTAMGLGSYNIKHRHLLEFLTYLKGDIVKCAGPKSDPRMALPNFLSPEKLPFTYRMHFMHSGKEIYPVSRLQTYLRPLIELSGLDKIIDLSE